MFCKYATCFVILFAPGLVLPELRAAPQEAPRGELAASSRAGKSAEPSSPHLHPGPPEPVADTAIIASIDRGVEFLLRDQRPDGSWGSPERTKGLNIIAGIGSHHGFRVATTALCVSALIELDRDRTGATTARRDAVRAQSSEARSSSSANCPGCVAIMRC